MVLLLKIDLHHSNISKCLKVGYSFDLESGGISCGCDASSDASNATLSCNITYAESTLQPSYPTMTWTRQDSGNVVLLNDKRLPNRQDFVQQSVSTLTITANDAPTYVCNLTFSDTDPFPVQFLSTGAPDFTATCTIDSKYTAFVAMEI